MAFMLEMELSVWYNQIKCCNSFLYKLFVGGKMKFEKKDLFNVPNILTYARLLCVPLFIGVMIGYNLNKSAWWFLFIAFIVFIGASITDIVDGAIARKHNLVSDIGKLLDPLADKLLQMAVIIMLVVVGNVHWAFMAIVIAKEVYMIIMTKYFLAASKRQLNQHSNVWGKVGAVMVFVALIIGFGARIHKIIMWMDMAVFVIAIGFAFFAAMQYTVMYTKELNSLKRSGALKLLNKNGEKIAESGNENATLESVDIETNIDESIAIKKLVVESLAADSSVVKNSISDNNVVVCTTKDKNVVERTTIDKKVDAEKIDEVDNNVATNENNDVESVILKSDVIEQKPQKKAKNNDKQKKKN